MELPDTTPEIAPWLLATIDDVAEADICTPIASSTAAEANELADVFRSARKQETDNTPQARVLDMISSVCGMHFKPEDANAPFGPMLVLQDRRSADLPDFRGPPLQVLEAMHDKIASSVVRARLADVCWTIDHKRGRLGLSAIESYVDIVRAVDAGTLRFQFDEEEKALDHRACEILRRAFQIGKATGWNKPEIERAKALAGVLYKRSAERQDIGAVRWFATLCLDYGILTAAEGC